MSRGFVACRLGSHDWRRLVVHDGFCTGMSEDQQRFLALLGRLPARLTAEQAAWVLNCQAHDMPILVSSRLLKPLGNPPPNGVKFFAAADVLELAKDRAWLVKVTNAVTGHWQKKNRAKKGHPLSVPADGPSAIQAVRTAA